MSESEPSRGAQVATMPVDPLLNVYSGEDALLDYYMPDVGPPVPVCRDFPLLRFYLPNRLS